MAWKNAAVAMTAMMMLTGCEDLLFWEQLEVLDEDWGVTDAASFRDALADNGKDLLDTTLTPGMVVVLLEDGEVVWGQSFGVADADTEAGLSPDTSVFQVASLSKAVTAWSVGRVVEEGALTWEEPVAPHLTRWALPLNGYDSEEVQVFRLLNHRAGLSVSGFVGWTSEQEMPSLVEVLDGTPSSFGEAVEVAYPPGEGSVYSGGGFAVAQLLVEEVTGESFESWTNREVCDALGLGMRMGYDPSLAPRLVSGHDRTGRVEDEYRFVATSAAGVYATPADYAAFLAAWLDTASAERGRGVLRPETVDRLVSQDMGIFDDTRMGVPLWTHTGANLGFKNAFALQPDVGDGIVVFTNGDNGELVYDKILDEWARSL